MLCPPAPLSTNTESWPLVGNYPKGRRHVTDHTHLFGEGGASPPKQPRPVTAPRKRRQQIQPAPPGLESAEGEAQEKHRQEART